MADSTTAVQAFSPAFGTTNADRINSKFFREVTQAIVESDGGIASPSPSSNQNDFLLAEGLLDIDTATLVLFNDISTNPRNPDIIGNLTTQQLQAIDTLQEDLQRLQEIEDLNTILPLTESATTVDLSAQAQAITTILAQAPTSDVSADAATSLTPEQLSQLGSLFEPLANQPITPNLVTQIQTQLSGINVSPLQFNLNNIYLVLNYLAGLQNPSADAIKAARIPSADIVNRDAVAPINPIDKVGAEDTAIL